jgi:predicted kinase
MKRLTGLAALQALVPPPGATLDDEAICETFPVVRSFEGVVQDPIHHAEGDVRIHTTMVLACLLSEPRFALLPPREQTIVFIAALLHDVAKPITTTIDGDGRVHARGHSAKGAIVARTLLWELGVDHETREAICGLVLFHQVPFFLINHDDKEAERKALRMAESCRLDLLELVAWADAAGRRCHDQAGLLERVALFGELVAELGVARTPFAFTDDHSRFRYFRDDRRTRHDVAFDDTVTPVTILVGLPATGKDRFVNQHAGDAEVISLDDLRTEHGLEHGGGQTRVASLAMEQFKACLRQRRPVMWNATNLVRDLRSKIIDVADTYRARVRIVMIEASPTTIATRNRARDLPVPAASIARMLHRWEPPHRGDAHQLDVVVSE